LPQGPCLLQKPYVPGIQKVESAARAHYHLSVAFPPAPAASQLSFGYNFTQSAFPSAPTERRGLRDFSTRAPAQVEDLWYAVSVRWPMAVAAKCSGDPLSPENFFRGIRDFLPRRRKLSACSFSHLAMAFNVPQENASGEGKPRIPLGD
jgi:hypothetical protein